MQLLAADTTHGPSLSHLPAAPPQSIRLATSNNFRLGFPLAAADGQKRRLFRLLRLLPIYLYADCGVVHRTRALSDGLASHFSAAYLGPHPSGMLLVSALTIDQRTAAHAPPAGGRLLKPPLGHRLLPAGGAPLFGRWQ